MYYYVNNYAYGSAKVLCRRMIEEHISCCHIPERGGSIPIGCTRFGPSRFSQCTCVGRQKSDADDLASVGL
jgi:hypothetical protein